MWLQHAMFLVVRPFANQYCVLRAPSRFSETLRTHKVIHHIPTPICILYDLNDKDTQVSLCRRSPRHGFPGRPLFAPGSLSHSAQRPTYA